MGSLERCDELEGRLVELGVGSLLPREGISSKRHRSSREFSILSHFPSSPLCARAEPKREISLRLDTDAFRSLLPSCSGSFNSIILNSTLPSYPLSTFPALFHRSESLKPIFVLADLLHTATIDLNWEGLLGRRGEEGGAGVFREEG